MLRQHVWCHLGFLRERSRKFHGLYILIRVSRYPNSTSTFRLTRLLISWDIHLNPGPNTAKTSCPTCSRTIARNHRSFVCNSCKGDFHIKCGKVTPKQFHQLQKNNPMNWSYPGFIEVVTSQCESNLSAPFASVENLAYLYGEWTCRN